MPNDETEADRQYIITRYNADRTHEVELEKVSAQYELAFFQAAALLNGGSSTVFVSFLGSTLARLDVRSVFLLVSFLLWIAGLGLALWGGYQGYEAQKHFVSARRNRRHAIGTQALGEERYARLLGVGTPDSAETLSARAEKYQNDATLGFNRARSYGLWSMALFLVGAILAVGTVMNTAGAKKEVETGARTNTITCYRCSVQR